MIVKMSVALKKHSWTSENQQIFQRRINAEKLSVSIRDFYN